MGRIVANFFISLDGVVEAPDQWHFPYFDEAMGRVVEEGMSDSRGMVMGHRLYDEWADYWPHQPEGTQPAELFNAMPKYVLAHDDFDADWNNTTVFAGADDESVAAQVRALKDATDGNLLMSGSATTVRWLITQGLLDELALLVHPIAVGQGQRLFEDTADRVHLELRHSETLPSGVLHLRYTPAAPAA